MRAYRLLPLSIFALGALTVFACGDESTGSFENGPPKGDDPPPGFLSAEGGPSRGDGASNGPRCGNASIDVGESCDDGNARSNDGCSSDCAVEPGSKCLIPGAACEASACGDGIVAGTEDCDDGNTANEDGCSTICRLESGFKCPIPGATCEQTVCGDGKKEGTEQCDDGNKEAFDGCSPTCTVEPSCSGGTCTAVCGDDLKFPGEDCDDGNTRDGDGCSATCKLEPGFTCNVVVTQPPGLLSLPIVYRDFLPKNYDGTIVPGYAAHPDFEAYGTGLCTDLVETTLDANNKPVLKRGGPCGDRMTSVDSFKQWYRDGLRNGDNLLVNKRIDDTLTLTKDPVTGSYVFDSDKAPYSSNKFFPIEAKGFGIEKGMTDPSNVEHNFHFTSEFKYWFTFKAGSDPKLEFRGDDDVWVFINNKRAVDLGGVHDAQDGSVTLNAAKAVELGLTDGGMYEITVFQAERQTKDSNYKLTLSGFERARTECVSVCGDSVKTRSEACDDGTAENTGGYGKCAPDCTLGARCGDGELQGGEECDDGNLVDGDTCSSSCKTMSVNVK